MGTGDMGQGRTRKIWLAGLAAVTALVVWAIYSLATIPVVSTYAYVSSCGHFEDVEAPQKGRTLDYIQALFAEHRAECGDEEAVLLRTFQREWGNLLDWPGNFAHPRWKVPYRGSAG